MAKIFRALLIAAVNTIKEFFAFATRDCLEPRAINIINSGCKEIDTGVFSSLSGAYIQSENTFDFKNANSWEVKIKYTYAGGGSEPMIWASGPSDYCGAILLTSTSTNKVRLYATSTGPYSWDIFFDAYLNVTMQIGGIYHFKLGFNTTEGYYFYAYKEGEANDYPSSPNWSDSTTTKIKSNTACQFLNWGLNYSNYYSSGNIDFKETSITVDGSTTYFSSFPLEVHDSVKLNDGMATSNYDWSAYPSDTEITGDYTQTGTVEAIKEINGETVYVTQEPEQDNKDVSIKAGEMYYAYTNSNDESVYATDNPVKERTFILNDNATVIGTLNNNNGVYSGFSNNDFINLGKDYKSQNNAVYEIRFMPVVSSNSGQQVINCEPLFNLDIIDGKLYTYNFGERQEKGGATLDLNIMYDAKITINNYNKIFELKKANEQSYTTIWSGTDNGMNTTANTDILIGRHSTLTDSSLIFSGSIDMNNTSINIDGVITTFGSFSTPSTLYENIGTTEFTPVALDPQPSFTIKEAVLLNCTNNGCTDLGNGIYQGGSGKYLIMNNTPAISTADSWEVRTVYTHNGGGSSSSGVVGIGGTSDRLCPILIVQGGYFKFLIGTNASSWDINTDNSSLSPQNGHTYYLKFGFTGSNYYIKCNEDGWDYTFDTIFSKNDSRKAYCVVPFTFIGNKAFPTDGYANGTIDMSQTSITIDNDTTNFYDPKSGIIIENILYERNSSADETKSISGVSVAIDTIDNTTIQSVTIDTTDGYIDTPYYAYTNENDNTDTLYATDNPVSKGIFSLHNATKEGNILIDDNGVMSEITSSNYVQITPFTAYTTSFEFVSKVKLSTSGSSAIIGNGDDNYSGGGFVLRTDNGTRLYLWGIYNYSSWDIGQFNTGIDLPTNGDWLYIKMTWDGSKYEFWKSSDGESYGQRVSYFDSSTPFCVPYVSKIGASGNTNFYFKGNIDLSETYYIVDGNKTTFGSFSDPSTLYENTGTTEFVPAILDPQPAFEKTAPVGIRNATEYGTLTNNNGVYSGFTTATNYIKFDVALTGVINMSLDPFTFVTSITTGNSVALEPILSNYLSGSGDYLAIREGYLAFYSNAAGWYIGNTLMDTNTNYWIAFNLVTNPFVNYYHAINDGTYTVETLPPLSDTSFWTKDIADLNRSLGMGKWNVGTNSSNVFSGSVDLSNTKLITNNVPYTFYNTKYGIIISDTLYERNIDKDNFNRETVPATIETSANITTSNNDSVITDGGYRFFNLTAPTGMTPIIEGSGASYQVNEMPLLLKNNSNVGLLLKDNNSSYYRNYWVVNRDYDLHYQQINFSYPSGATVTCKVNNAEQSNLAPYVYCGDIVSWTCDNSGTITTGTYTVKYSNLDGNIQTITIS